MEANNLHLSFPAEIKKIADVLRTVDNWNIHEGLVERCRLNIKLILDELLSNICHYAGLPNNVCYIELTLCRKDESVVVTIRDSGIPFNPLEKKPPDLMLPLEERPIGGLGIFLVKRISRQVEYRRENNQNVLTAWIDE